MGCLVTKASDALVPNRLPRLAFSPREVAVALSVSYQVIYRKVLRGEIKTIRLTATDRRHLIPVTELKRLLTEVGLAADFLDDLPDRQRGAGRSGRGQAA